MSTSWTPYTWEKVILNPYPAIVCGLVILAAICILIISINTDKRCDVSLKEWAVEEYRGKTNFKEKTIHPIVSALMLTFHPLAVFFRHPTSGTRSFHSMLISICGLVGFIGASSVLVGSEITTKMSLIPLI